MRHACPSGRQIGMCPCQAQVLQKAVDVALAVLRDIEDFSESLRGRELSVARGKSPAAGELATPAVAARKLRSLIGGWLGSPHKYFFTSAASPQ